MSQPKPICAVLFIEFILTIQTLMSFDSVQFCLFSDSQF
nr:MAG TPA: hypothetical protein [Inoviridae sp.]